MEQELAANSFNYPLVVLVLVLPALLCITYIHNIRIIYIYYYILYFRVYFIITDK